MMLIIVQTAVRRYAVRRGDVTSMLPVHSEADILALGSPQHPALPIELGAWFDPADQLLAPRRHALVVPLRRRPIVFQVERVEQALENPVIQPIPELITKGLREVWALGVIDYEQQLAVLIDLRAVARSIMLQHRQDS
jgi:hypothetical protein